MFFIVQESDAFVQRVEHRGNQGNKPIAPTMNIDGHTVHHWAGIPGQDSMEERRSNPADIDDLFIRCQSLRWILIDEISMVSAELFAELQKRVAQAASDSCAYKRRPDKSPRPFGGVNVLIDGDNWQLRPVKATALFDRPSAGRSLLATAGLRLMWSRDRDSVQRVAELSEPMRCSDPWFQNSFLAEARDGQLCIDNYFFIHGAPTALVGSMIPGEAAPRCGNASCLDLQQGGWAASFKAGERASEQPGKVGTARMDAGPHAP